MIMKRYPIFLFTVGLIFPTVLFAQEDLEKLFEKEIQKKEYIPVENNIKDFTGRPSQFQLPILRNWNLDIMAALDTVYEWDNNEEATTKRQYTIRTGEFGFYSAIDHLAFATFTWAAHNEGGKLFPEIHEANFLFPSTIIPRTNIRLGRMFPDVGRINGIHQHDWYFTTPPIVHEKLLAYEGILDDGIEFHFLFPWFFWQELSLGIFNGKMFGHAHDEGERKQNPLYTLHLKQFFPISEYWGTQFGFSFLRWHPDTNPRKWNEQFGLDFFLKFSQGKLKSFIFQSEIWYRETKEKTKDPWKYFLKDNFTLKTLEDFSIVSGFDPPKRLEIQERNSGIYYFIQYQVTQQWFLGYRYDYFYTPSKERINEYTYQRERQKNGLEENSGILTYKPSEFSYYRLQASTRIDFETGKRTWNYYFQAVFIIGLHPAHIY